MKRKTLLGLIGLLPMVCFLASCGKENLANESSIRLKPETSSTSVQQKLSRDILDLSSSDAAILANLYSGPAQTKASCRQVREVIPITNDNGKTVMYAVNYDDGYIIVSATRKYFPVLADVEHGSFSFGDKTGSMILVDEMAEAIDRVEAGEVQVDCETVWSKYLDGEIRDIPTTKVVRDEYYDLLETYQAEWYDQGIQSYYLRTQPSGMPDELYASFCSMAESDMAEVSGYPYMECAIITVEQSDGTQYGPYLTTAWNQSESCSPLYGEYLGCVTVATGQLMRYFEYPSTFNWGVMPNEDDSSSSGCVVRADFLEQLHDDLGVSTTGGASIADAERTLTEYGYSCYISSPHSSNTVHSSLVRGNPVYMRGTNSYNTVSGHAWVCDGFRFFNNSTKYSLYLLTFSNGVPNALELWYDTTIYETSQFTYYHMNWGWGGLNDGYFLDSNIACTSSSNYSVDRTDIIVTGHN